MIYPKIPLAQSIIQICLAKQITQIVISPGSRNAPLTLGFANNPSFVCYSVVDERCAAFFALGIAQQTQSPVVLICTSGSALLNYYPAIAEAFYSQIPLVIISADRPSNKIDIGDGQTIRQVNVFKNHTVFNANLSEEASKENDFLIDKAINCSVQQCGPVHINAPFEEPLYELVDNLSVSVKITNNLQENKQTKPSSSEINLWNKSEKKLVLIGASYPNSYNKDLISFLANDTSVMVMTEACSNIHHQNFISNIDTIITPFSEKEFEYFRPEILVTLGGMIVSKRIKSYLRKYKPQHHWHIDSLRAYDTFGCLSQHFEAIPNEFFKHLYSSENHNDSKYQTDFLEVKYLREKKHFSYLEKIIFSDLKVFEKIINSLPKNILLQISNSTPIRYAQLFDIEPSIDVFCNRGTSGIDGSTSTAIGAAVASKKPTLLITGDIGFFYDSNALWNNYIPNNFKIILLNNGGGGIFRILPGHSENEIFNHFFETHHKLNAKNLAQMYDLEYFAASDETSLKDSLNNLYKYNSKPCILEIFTPTLLNDKILSDYFKKIV